jgi:hypothetical protein
VKNTASRRFGFPSVASARRKTWNREGNQFPAENQCVDENRTLEAVGSIPISSTGNNAESLGFVAKPSTPQSVRNPVGTRFETALCPQVAPSFGKARRHDRRRGAASPVIVCRGSRRTGGSPAGLDPAQFVHPVTRAFPHRRPGQTGRATDRGTTNRRGWEVARYSADPSALKGGK